MNPPLAPIATLRLLFAGLCLLAATVSRADAPVTAPVFPDSFTAAGNLTARGRVVSAGGDPVAGAAVTCSEIFLSGYARRLPENPLTVATDGNGFFSFPSHLGIPNETQDAASPPYPPGSRYLLEVRPPDHAHAFCTVAIVSNTQPETVKLLRAIEPHRFVVETEPGVWVDGIDLPPDQTVDFLGATLSYRKVWIPLPPDVLERGGPLPAGRYRPSGNRRDYPSVEVGPESPGAIALALPPAPTLKGRIVDGVTGQTLPRAVAILYRASGPGNRDLPDILDADFWSKVDALAPGAVLDEHSTGTLIHDRVSDARLARVRADGAFTLTQSPGSRAWGLLVVARGKLPHLHYLSSHNRDAAGQLRHTIDFETTPLFPAAVLKLNTLLADVPANKGSVHAHWRIAGDATPAGWQHDVPETEDGLPGILYMTGERQGSRSHRLFVPAGIDFTLWLNGYSRWSTPRAPLSLKLSPGDIDDVGTFQFARLPQVQIRIVGPDGEPLPGVSTRVRIPDRERGWLGYRQSNTNGELDVPVDPRTGSTIRVEGTGKPYVEATVLPSANLDEHPPIILRLTADQLKTVFKAND